MPAPDFTEQYNTKLSEADEGKFQDWLIANGRHGDLYNYDMRGWWKENGKEKADVGKGHLTDEFKKPNHPTFSEESNYSKGETKGGKWGKEGGKDTFKPSPTNLQNMTSSELTDYFAKIEPEAKLLLPTPMGALYDNPRSVPSE